MYSRSHFAPIHIPSSQFPAGTLLDTYYDRDVTRLSDRGLASNMIGDRWSDVCAQALAAWPGTQVTLPDGVEIIVEHVYRLDDIPRIASIASKRKLQNPDFIVVGRANDAHLVFAVDAKFSIDTAKSSQVAADTLTALLELGQEFTDLFPELPAQMTCVDGYFLSPDAPLTDWVLTRTRGRLAARVAATRVIRLPIAPVELLKPLDGARLMTPLAALDGFRNEIRSNLLLALYYFRLARACYGAYRDATNPIFGRASHSLFSVDKLEQETMAVARQSRSAWDVILTMDARAEQVRRQRETAQAAMPFPIANRDLRDRLQKEAESRAVPPPSMNSVRKALGGWYRAEFDERIGLVLPPVEDIGELVARIQEIARELEPLVPAALDEAIDVAFSRIDPDQTIATA